MNRPDRIVNPTFFVCFPIRFGQKNRPVFLTQNMTNDQPPIAYEVVSERGREAVYAADLKANAERACEANGWRLVPIYEPVTEQCQKPR